MVREWDKGVDFEVIRNRIINKIEEYKNREGRKNIIILSKLIVYSIQLRNGCRISEALEAFYKFLNNQFEVKEKKKLVKVRVRKKRNFEERYITWPEWVPFYLISKIKAYRINLSVNSLKVSAKNLIGVNTHTLRYAFITYLAKKGINPSLIAKITHHSRLDYILKYTQQKIADEILLKAF